MSDDLDLMNHDAVHHLGLNRQQSQERLDVALEKDVDEFSEAVQKLEKRLNKAGWTWHETYETHHKKHMVYVPGDANGARPTVKRA
jgi:hypothetical protein